MAARRREREASPTRAGAATDPGKRDDPHFLKVNGIGVSYGATRVLENLDLSVARGEFVALLGSSGCGKTTLLRTIAGFIKPNAGSVHVAGTDVTAQPPDKRGMALVFQSYALWPHMTVAQNIGYGLKLRRRPRAEIAGRVKELQALLGLDGLGERKPANLSGGQRQRVALGRALAVEPNILLLDEPLSNLDTRIRQTVRHEISALQRRLGITAIHVTHDREEAMVMADRIVILNAGVIAQVGTPEEVFNHPASDFVAAFMGADNVLALKGRRSQGRLVIEPGANHAAAVITAPAQITDAGRYVARFRSEVGELFPADAAPDGETAQEALLLDGEIAQVSYPGGQWRHLVDIGETIIVVDAARPFEPGARVRVKVPGEALFVFPEAATDG